MTMIRNSPQVSSEYKQEDRPGAHPGFGALRRLGMRSSSERAVKSCGLRVFPSELRGAAVSVGPSDRLYRSVIEAGSVESDALDLPHGSTVSGIRRLLDA